MPESFQKKIAKRKAKRVLKKSAGTLGGSQLVIQKGKAKCNKGDKTPKFKALINDFLYANSQENNPDYLAITENDLFFDPISVPFGVCKVSGGNCLYVPKGKWKKTYADLKTKGLKVLTNKSYLRCVVGGKIKVKDSGQRGTITTCNGKTIKPSFQRQLNGLVAVPELMDRRDIRRLLIYRITHRKRGRSLGAIASGSKAPTIGCPDGSGSSTIGGGGGGNGGGGSSSGGYSGSGGDVSLPPSNGTCECAVANMVWGSKITCDQRRKVIEVSKNLGLPEPSWLMAVMALETARTFSPSIRNSLGYTGLIQFGKDAAKDLGTTTDALRGMSFIQQMDYVQKFLIKRKDRYKTLVDLYLSVLYPVASGKGSDPNYIVLRGREHRANPAFHKERPESGVTYIWEIDSVIKGLYNEGKSHMVKDYSNCKYDKGPAVPPVGECKETGYAKSDAKIAQLHPAIQCHVRNFLNEVKQVTGRTYQVHSGYRSFAEQEEVRRRGHSTVGPGGSYHNYGLAVDISWVQPGGRVDFNDTKSLDLVADIGKKHGFYWGGDWKKFVDKPHFQMSFGYKCSQLKQMYFAVGQDYKKIKLP